jgi:hypothetical protein
MRHRKVSIFRTLCLGAALVVPASLVYAQTTPVPPTTQDEITEREVRNFDGYLDQHPEVAQQLKQNPNLINDPNYLSQHKELQQFLNTHPNAAAAIKQNPQKFMTDEKRFNNREAEIKRTAGFDNYLDQHPQQEKDLMQNPNLINDPKYMAEHPELQQYLQSHPHLAEQLKTNPKQVMNRERHFDQKEKQMHKNNAQPHHHQ